MRREKRQRLQREVRKDMPLGPICLNIMAFKPPGPISLKFFCVFLIAFMAALTKNS